MTILLTDKKVATILEPRHMLECGWYMGTDAAGFEEYLAEADSHTRMDRNGNYYEKQIEHYHR
jgi:hypothetical protein